MSPLRWRLITRLAVFVFCVLWISSSANADDLYYPGPDDARLAPRNALVIGIPMYSEAIFPRLPNATNDVKKITEVLVKLGFDVYPTSNSEPLTRQNLKRILYDYIKRVRRIGGASLIYFAGHGLAYNSLSYLVPFDAMAVYTRDLREELIPLDLISDALKEMPDAYHIVILDACRDPGLGKLPNMGTAEIIEATAGVKFDPPRNSAFSTSAKEGQKARDGKKGENSPFAYALSSYIQKPNQPIEVIFNNIKLYFNNPPFDTEDPQSPTFSNEGGASFFFAPTQQTFADEKKYWDAIDHKRARASDYRDFLKRFPAGYFATQARTLRNRAPSLDTAPLTKEVIIMGDVVRLRDNQSETATFKKTYNTGERALVLSENGDWTFLQIVSDHEIGYVKSSFVKPAPSREERLALSYLDANDDPPAELENLLNRLAISDITNVRIATRSDQLSLGLALARVQKVQSLLGKKGVNLTIVAIEPVSLPDDPTQLNKIQVILNLISRAAPQTQPQPQAQPR